MVHAEVVRVPSTTGPGGTAGPLRMDMARVGQEYSLADARQAFQRQAVHHRAHGWGGGSGPGMAQHGVMAAASEKRGVRSIKGVGDMADSSILRLDPETGDGQSCTARSLQPRPTPPHVSLRALDADGRVMQDAFTMDDLRGFSAKFTTTTLQHTKALVSLLDLDLQAMWPGGSERERLEMVMGRISNMNDAATAGAFAMQAQHVQLDAQQAAYEILRNLNGTVSLVQGSRKRYQTNFLCKFLEMCLYNLARLPGLCSRCFLCGSPHPRPAPVPMPCSKRLCRYKLSQTRLCMEMLPHIHARPAVVELLLSLAAAACQDTARCQLVMTPPPVEFLDAQGKPDFAAMKTALARMPPLGDMHMCKTDGELRRLLNRETATVRELEVAEQQREEAAKEGTDPNSSSYQQSQVPASPARLAQEEQERQRQADADVAYGHKLYMLLWWVFSNIPDYLEVAPLAEVRSYLASNGLQGQVAALPADSAAMVFRMQPMGMPELHTTFLRNVEARGSLVAFHGSKLPNWYSILKHGVRSMAGVQGYQLNGAAYGPGIYVSPVYSTSVGYSGITHTSANTAAAVASELLEASIGGAGESAPPRWAPTHLNGVRGVVAVCQVARNAQITSSSSVCHVIAPATASADCICIRYLVVHLTGSA
eukprot:gene13890-19816_t